MKKGLKKIGLGLVAVGLSIVLLLIGAIPSHATPGEEKVVKIGHDTALTGPLASTYLYGHYGTADIISYLNREFDIDEAVVPKGVLAVRRFYEEEEIKLEQVWYDTTAVSMSKSLIAFKRFVVAGVVGELICTTTPCEVLTPSFQREEIPAIFVIGLTPPMITQPIRWVISMYAGVGPEVATFMNWIKGNWTEERSPRIGCMGYDHASALEAIAATEELAPKMGFEYVGREVTPTVVIDTSTEWLRMAAKNPDWIYVPTCGSTLVTMVKDAARLEIQGREIGLCSGAWGIDEIVMRPMGKDAEGWYVIRPHPSTVETDVLLTRFSFELAKKGPHHLKPPEDAPSHYRAGLVFFATWGEAVKLAIEKVGYENLSGRAVRDALVSIRDYDIGVGPLITITEERPYVFSGMKMYQVREGGIWPITDWLPYAYHYPELTKGK